MSLTKVEARNPPHSNNWGGGIIDANAIFLKAKLKMRNEYECFLSFVCKLCFTFVVVKYAPQAYTSLYKYLH